MMGAMGNWFSALSNREKILVGVAGGLLLALTLFYAGWGLLAAHKDARLRYQSAVESSGRVAAQLAQLQRSKSARPPGFAQSLHLVVAASAAEAGFTLDTNNPDGNSATDVTIASARPAALFAWLYNLEQQGILTQSLSVRPDASGNVSASGKLRLAGT